MLNYIRLTTAAVLGCLLCSCAQISKPLVSAANSHRLHVRTTAYTRGEGSGSHNALGAYLSGRHVKSAASDWSRFPLGTRFRVVGSDEEYIIDDYGTALIGTNTIDLYKSSRAEMNQWGVRRVDIDVLQWGSREQSLKVLTPRSKHPIVRKMMLALQRQSSTSPKVFD